MKSTPSHSETGRPMTGYRNLLSALIAATAFNGTACNQLAQPMTPDNPSSSVLSTQSRPTPLPFRKPMNLQPHTPDFGEPEIFAGSLVFPMTITFKPVRKAWPDVPALCVYTGTVLEHDRDSEPHKILLEKLCLQKRVELDKVVKNIYDGQHRWVDADTKSHYEIPFKNSHLEEKKDNLVFVTEIDGNRVEEGLNSDDTSGTLSFAGSLDTHHIRPIVNSLEEILQK